MPGSRWPSRLRLGPLITSIFISSPFNGSLPFLFQFFTKLHCLTRKEIPPFAIIPVRSNYQSKKELLTYHPHQNPDSVRSNRHLLHVPVFQKIYSSLYIPEKIGIFDCQKLQINRTAFCHIFIDRDTVISHDDSGKSTTCTFCD